jgi:O-antigen/teichoic acid export membrane protein
VIRKVLNSNNAVSFLGNLVAAIFQLFSFSLLARSLSPELFGKWSLFMAGAALTDMFRFGLTRNSIVWSLSNEPDSVREKVLGANYSITLASTAIIIVLLVLTRIAFRTAIDHSGFSLFFIWFPLLSVVTLPFNNALSILRADEKFNQLLVIKVINYGGFIAALGLLYIFKAFNIENVVYAYLLMNLIASTMIVTKGWDGLKNLFDTEKKSFMSLLHFGKYSIGSIIGSNLLKSADTFIIGLSPLGAAAVSQFVVAMKFTEALELPLRTMLATVFPDMVRAFKGSKPERINVLLHSYVIITTLLFGVIGLACVLGSKYVIWIIGGEGYAENGISMYILMVFAFYGLFLPADRFLGVAIDSINQPKYNFMKVFYMAIANIAGDIIAVFVFHSILLVAVATVIFTILGVFLGNYYMPVELRLTFRSISAVRLKSSLKLVLTH